MEQAEFTKRNSNKKNVSSRPFRSRQEPSRSRIFWNRSWSIHLFFFPLCSLVIQCGPFVQSASTLRVVSQRDVNAHCLQAYACIPSATLYLRLGGGSTDRMAITISGHYDRMGSVQRRNTDELTEQAAGTVYHCISACVQLQRTVPLLPSSCPDRY